MTWPPGLSLWSALWVGLASAGLTWTVRRAARRFGFLSMPSRDRWHQTPTATLGGVAIFLAFLVGFLLFVPKEPGNWVLLAGGAAMFVVGLADDLFRVKPHVKLLAQILVATPLVAWGTLMPLSADKPLNLLITLAWLVGISNAMNLLDNMDGLCAGVALIAALYRLLLCSMEGHAAGVSLALVFIAAVVGFLVFNLHPASIFMGDSGSLFIGLTLAGYSLSATHTSAARGILATLLIPVLCLVIPIFDTTLVTLTRHLSGRPLLEGGRDHSSHRLVAIGLSETRAVETLCAMSALGGGIACLSYLQGFSYSVFFVSLFGVGLTLFGVYLARAKIQNDRPAIGRAGRRFSFPAQLANKKPVFAVISDVLLVGTAYYGAYWLRFDGFSKEPAQLDLFLSSMPMALVFALASFHLFGLYRYAWRYTGIRDLWVALKATAAAVVATVLFSTFVYRFEGYSRSVFVIYWGALFLFTCGSRLSFRLFAELLESQAPNHRRVLIYGAGDAGELLLRELKVGANGGRTVVGFLDDDPSWAKCLIHGVPVLGGAESVEHWIRKESVKEVIISSVDVPPELVAQLEEVCGRLGVGLRRAMMRIEPVESSSSERR